MRIAILGANGLIARDLCERLLVDERYDLILYTRHPELVDAWASSAAWFTLPRVFPYAGFPDGPEVDAVINFVGIGNPREATALGRKMFELSNEFDEHCLQFMRSHPNCKYFFISSGAVFGENFEHPVDASSQAHINFCQPKPEDWYGLAKLHAEVRHRSLPDLPIIDIRVFSYVSRNLDLSSQFFMSDIIRHIIEERVLQTSHDYIVRDYLHPDDFRSLIDSLLAAPFMNLPLDAYSQAPIGKPDLLHELHSRFGLKYALSPQTPLKAVAPRSIYYSQNRTAEMFGYRPSRSSLEGIVEEVQGAVNRLRDS